MVMGAVVSVCVVSAPTASASCWWSASSAVNRAVRWVWMAARASTAKRGESRIQVGIGVDLRTINVEFFAPDQFLLLALLHNGVKETAKDLHAVAIADLGQTRMIGKRFV